MRRIASVLAAAAIVLAGCGGGGANGVAVTAGASGEVPGDAANGRALFDGTCIACHGPGGVGLPNLGKTLIDNEFVQSNSDIEMIGFISEGRPASDPANTTGVDMPPRGGNPSLGDQDLADIVQYLRTLQ